MSLGNCSGSTLFWAGRAQCELWRLKLHKCTWFICWRDYDLVWVIRYQIAQYFYPNESNPCTG
jgi:hypothetical protein